MRDVIDIASTLGGLEDYEDLDIEIRGFNRTESFLKKLYRGVKIALFGRYKNVRYPKFIQATLIGIACVFGIGTLAGISLLLDATGLGNEPHVLQIRMAVYTAFATAIDSLYKILQFLLDNKLVTFLICVAVLLIALKR